MKIRAIRSTAICVVALTGCSSGKDMSVAEAQVPVFHQQMVAQNFDDIYAQSDDILKRAATSKELTSLLEAVNRKLGSVTEATRTGWRVNYGTGGEVVTLQYDTHFARGKGVETFVYQINHNKALLAGYHITSNELIIN